MSKGIRQSAINSVGDNFWFLDKFDLTVIWQGESNILSLGNFSVSESFANICFRIPIVLSIFPEDCG